MNLFIDYDYIQQIEEAYIKINTKHLLNNENVAKFDFNFK